MTSTRNKNMINDYCLEQKKYNNYLFYNIYQNGASGTAFTPALPEAGGVPSDRMSRDNLAYNPIDIENSLFGIGSSNLVNPQKKLSPHFKYLPTISFFERNKLIMPHPLNINSNERTLLQ